MEKIYFKKEDINKIPLWKDNKPILGRLDIELTERCNNNCIHCYINLPADDATSKEKELLTEDIKNILQEAVSLGCMEVRFTGGEPLLREDFDELYVYTRKLGIKVVLFTNATLITPRRAELFSRIPLLEKIEVSVYGMKKSSYEGVTGVSGSYDAAMKGISLLIEHKIPFVVKGVVLPQNKFEIEEFDAWAAGIPWMGRPATYSTFFDLRCRRDDIKKNELIQKLRVTPEEGLKLFTRRGKEHINEMREFSSKFTRPPGYKIFSCGSGIGGGCVDAYGYLYPCLMLKHPDAAYDLKRGTLKDALLNFFPKIREIKATNPLYLSRCAKCFLKGLCEQCPAKSWMEHGTLDTPVEYLCEVAHARAKFLGLLEKDKMAWEVPNWKERIESFVGRNDK